jgi:transposase
MKLIHIIGADISKKSIDLFCHGLHEHFKIKNDVSGFKKMQLWLNKLELKINDLVIVMEHTGYYSFHFENFLHQNEIRFCKVSALAIKRSIGLVRGKTDKIDAQRIARYGYEKQDQLRAQIPMDAELHRLQILSSSRNLLVKQRSSLTCALKEYQVILKQSDPIIQMQLQLISGLTTQIKMLEKQMKELLSKPGASAENLRL